MIAAPVSAPVAPVVDPNEEIKNSEFAEPLLPAKLTKAALKGFDKDDKRSECGSIVSQASNKTAGGNIKKHCGPCKKIVVNWSQHKTKAHGGVDVESVKCTGL